MRGKKKKAIWILAGIVVIALAVTLGSIKLYRVKQARQSGILLAFDDYNPDNWSAYLDFFEEQHVPVTFFVTIAEPSEFCYDALKRGNEIGYHVYGHFGVDELDEEGIQMRVIDPIQTFHDGGIELTTFAYPYGNHDDETDQMMLQHYKVIRGAWYYEVYSKADLRQGYVEAYPIDNHYFNSDEAFQARIDQILNELSNNVGAVTCVYSRAIENGEWCVTEERLEYLIRKADELGLKFYTFQELQNN